MSVPQEAIDAHDAYWRVKETGDPPPFGELPVKLQQCWTAAAAVVAAAERERIIQLLEAEAPRYALGHTALRHFASLLKEPQQ